MTVHYCSDLHLDFYMKPYNSNFKYFYKQYFNDASGQVLIIAGDISHYNTQIRDFLKFVHRYFAHIIIVTGNHEFYNVSKGQRAQYTSLYSKFDELRTLLADLPYVHFLDGTSITIDSIKFAGAMGWYDCSYYYRLSQGLYSETMLSHWINYTNDARNIPTLNNPLDLFAIERPKLLAALSTSPDVMVTHFCPISDPVAIERAHVLDRGTGYYCFDSTTLGFAPIWIHGHMHSAYSFTHNSTTHMRNPLGYPAESRSFSLQSFDI